MNDEVYKKALSILLKIEALVDKAIAECELFKAQGK
jgi:hypothetical protein